MCGIAGIIQEGSSKEYLSNQIRQMLRTIKHRGPDDKGQYVTDSLVIGMTRLSIIDLESGSQPISNNDNSIILVCNGEIYNYIELKDMLQKKGYVFKTNSDVEVIIHGYEEFGEDFIQQLRGMFAFCLWDEKRKKIWLARDRLGIKPIYYKYENNTLIFCSEIKGILSIQENKTSFDYGQIRTSILKRYSDSNKTIFKGIKKIPPGSYFIIKNNNLIKKKYWSLENKNREIIDSQNYIDLYEEKLKDAVISHLVSDVPVGSFLSGGLDSSMVTAIASKYLNNDISTYTIGFNDTFSEHLYARQVSDSIGTNHVEEILRHINFDIFKSAIFHLEEPINDPAVVPTFLLSDIASKTSKVVLTGEGSDEINIGYNKYRYNIYNQELFGKSLNILPRNLLKMISRYSMFNDNKISNGLRRRIGYSLSASDSFLYSDSDLAQGIASLKLFSKSFLESTETDFMNSYKQTVGKNLDEYLMYDFLGFLSNDLLLKVDKMTMAHSLEARVPYLDHQFVEYAISIPHHLKIDKRSSKNILRTLSENYLSDEIVKRKQHGFLSPIDRWIKETWHKEIKALIFEGFLRQERIIEINALEKLFYQVEKKENNNFNHLIWGLATMNQVIETFRN